MGREIKIWCVGGRGESTVEGIFPMGGGMSKFSGSGDTPPISTSRESPVCVCVCGGGGGVHEKPIYRRELPKKGGLGKFAVLRGGLAKTWGMVFLRSGLIPQCTLWRRFFIALETSIVTTLKITKENEQKNAKI